MIQGGKNEPTEDIHRVEFQKKQEITIILL